MRDVGLQMPTHLEQGVADILVFDRFRQIRFRARCAFCVFDELFVPA